MRTTLRRGAPLVALALLALVGVDHAQAQVAYTANTVTSLYYKEIRKDERVLRLQQRRAAGRFEQSGETGIGITKLGAGPNGETVIADNERALELFFFKHGISEKVRPAEAAGPQRSCGATARRASRSDNVYMEMSNRIQVAFTHELPDEAVKLGGHGGQGRQQGLVPHPPREVQARGLDLQDLADVRGPAQLARRLERHPASYVEDANINGDVSKGKKRFLVKFGQFKVPFGRQQLTSSGSQQFVDRALVSEQYYRGRETGVALWGVLGNNKLDWRVGMFNGNGLTQHARTTTTSSSATPA